VSLRPRKKSAAAKNRFPRCKKCGGQVRRHIARCKKCSEKNF